MLLMTFMVTLCVRSAVGYASVRVMRVLLPIVAYGTITKMMSSCFRRCWRSCLVCVIFSEILKFKFGSNFLPYKNSNFKKFLHSTVPVLYSTVQTSPCCQPILITTARSTVPGSHHLNSYFYDWCIRHLKYEDWDDKTN